MCRRLYRTLSTSTQQSKGGIMEEPNKKLCELLGIEPVYKNDGVTLTLKEFKNTRMPQLSRDMFWIEHYPNLSEPENFVKLLQCYIDSGCFVTLDMCGDVIQHFLNVVEYKLKVNNVQSDELREQAQQQDWRY